MKFVKHLRIVNVISDDIKLSCQGRDGAKGEKAKDIIVPDDRVTSGEFADFASCPNVVDFDCP